MQPNPDTYMSTTYLASHLEDCNPQFKHYSTLTEPVSKSRFRLFRLWLIDCYYNWLILFAKILKVEEML